MCSKVEVFNIASMVKFNSFQLPFVCLTYSALLYSLIFPKNDQYSNNISQCYCNKRNPLFLKIFSSSSTVLVCFILSKILSYISHFIQSSLSEIRWKVNCLEIQCEYRMRKKQRYKTEIITQDIWNLFDTIFM